MLKRFITKYTPNCPLGAKRSRRVEQEKFEFRRERRDLPFETQEGCLNTFSQTGI